MRKGIINFPVDRMTGHARREAAALLVWVDGGLQADAEARWSATCEAWEAHLHSLGASDKVIAARLRRYHDMVRDAADAMRLERTRADDRSPGSAA